MNDTGTIKVYKDMYLTYNFLFTDQNNLWSTIYVPQSLSAMTTNTSAHTAHTVSQLNIFVMVFQIVSSEKMSRTVHVSEKLFYRMWASLQHMTV